MSITKDDKPSIMFTIEQWAKQEHELIDQFIAEWLEAHKDDPEHWPMELSAGQWDEQYISWHNDCSEPAPEDD